MINDIIKVSCYDDLQSGKSLAMLTIDDSEVTLKLPKRYWDVKANVFGLELFNSKEKSRYLLIHEFQEIGFGNPENWYIEVYQWSSGRLLLEMYAANAPYIHRVKSKEEVLVAEQNEASFCRIDCFYLVWPRVYSFTSSGTVQAKPLADYPRLIDKYIKKYRKLRGELIEECADRSSLFCSGPIELIMDEYEQRIHALQTLKR